MNGRIDRRLGQAPKGTKVKQIFKGHWGLYHISIAALLVLTVILGTVRLYWAYLGNGYTVSATTTLPYAQSQLWHWGTTDELRPLWQTGIYDVVRMYGDINEIESTRQVFIIDKGNRNLAVETTKEVDAGTRLQLLQEAVLENRSYTLTLRAISECETELTIREVGVLHDFWDTYFLFWTNPDRQGRIDASLVELSKWMVKRGETCPEGAES